MKEIEGVKSENIGYMMERLYDSSMHLTGVKDYIGDLLRETDDTETLNKWSSDLDAVQTRILDIYLEMSSILKKMVSANCPVCGATMELTSDIDGVSNWVCKQDATYHFVEIKTVEREMRE